VREGAGKAEQAELIDRALSFRPLPAMLRGSVRKLGDLGHGVWAADPDYGGKLVAMATNIRRS